ncbi:MAG TPA: cysteine peptidase family C39 domain-containing protein [Verrucomicrobiae bacterium]|jgi:predicted double-glycine peptidase|nr:cysteine peptidase family C39 domain-containing protein [Verrucomicrobiae bacterium]
MNPWVESLGVLLIAVGGTLLGAWCSRLPNRYWLIGYFIPLFLIALYAVASRFPILIFTPPISWMMLGRAKFASVGFIGAMMLTTPLLKLPLRRDRIALGCLGAVIVLLASVWPFLAPAFNHDYLASLVTRIDSDGVCLQNTAYTCGPASAVTALRKLGLPAEEGQVAILAHTSAAAGTPPDVLAQALAQEYSARGLVCTYRHFASVDELKRAGLTLAVVKFNLVLDHYVTVLDVSGDTVTVGDPLNGLTKMTFVEFADKWRFEGVVLSRK